METNTVAAAPKFTRPSLTDAAKLLRADLKKAFPIVKFSVRTERYSGGSSINISWADGPSVPQVDEIGNRYQDGSFDGMQDLYTYGKSTPENPGGAKYVSTHREFSAGLLEQVGRDYCKMFGVEYVSSNQYVEKCREWLGTLVHRATYRADLTRGYKGLVIECGQVVATQVDAA